MVSLLLLLLLLNHFLISTVCWNYARALKIQVDIPFPQRAHKEVGSFKNKTAIRSGSNGFSGADKQRFYWKTDKRKLNQREGLGRFLRRDEVRHQLSPKGWVGLNWGKIKAAVHSQLMWVHCLHLWFLHTSVFARLTTIHQPLGLCLRASLSC